MSENRTNELRRRLRYVRRIQRKKAVSPVVATLILILIAVAAAAALYLWLVAWQGGVTKGIGSPSAQYTVSIGGSTSAYPFAEEAATQFEANNSDVVVSVNQGGSGAGAAAVCSGQVDIGQASSFAYPVSTLISADGCPSTTVEQIVAYDGVDLITPTANAHGLQNMSWDTAQAIWTTASNEPAGYGGTTTSNIYANGNVHMNGVLAPVQLAQGSNYAWDQIPACDEAPAIQSGSTLYTTDNYCGGASNPGEGLEAPQTGYATGAAITAGGSAQTLVAGSNAETATATFTPPTAGTFYWASAVTGTLTYGGTDTAANTLATAISLPPSSETASPYAISGTAQFPVPTGYTWNSGDSITIGAADIDLTTASGCTTATATSGATVAPVASEESVSGTTLSVPFTGTATQSTCSGVVSAISLVATGDIVATLVPDASAFSITSQSLTSSLVTVNIGYSEIGLAGTSSTFSAPSISYYGIGSGVACGTSSLDICATASGSGTVSPCGFLVCAGGTSSNPGTHAIDLYYRSEVSGTTTGFLARLLAVSATGSLASGASGGAANDLSFSGCGGDNEFDGCGLAFTGSNDHGETGNPNVISAVAGDPNGLGYASDGLAQASTSGVVPVNFEGYGQQVTVVIVGESTALKAIAAGISAYFTSSTTFATSQNYVGWRPFVNIETAPPTGEVERYLEFVMDPANNQNIAAETAEISIYASGLAGVVPITPIEGSTTLP